MNETSSAQPEFAVTQEEFDAASANLDLLTQETEVGIRQYRARIDELFERISDEVVARLNEEQADPDGHDIAEIVQRVFERYFGRSVRVHVEKGPQSSFKLMPKFCNSDEGE